VSARHGEVFQDVLHRYYADGSRQAAAIWAIYVWCRRTTSLWMGRRRSLPAKKTLDRWESQLESIFAGCPVDDEDVALVDTLEQFPLDIQPFRDMIAGQRMDLHRSRYDTFEDLELYCYRVAGTVGLMSTTVMGIDTQLKTAPESAARPGPDPPGDRPGHCNHSQHSARRGRGCPSRPHLPAPSRPSCL
jgi:hypothetical protein